MAYYSLGGVRLKPKYSDIIRAEAPAAQQAHYNKKAKDLQQRRFGLSQQLARDELAQQKQQYEDTLAQNKEQFDIGLSESRRQFDETSALQKQQAEDAKKKADLATGVTALGVGVEAYPYLQEGVTGLSDLLFADSAVSSAPAVSTSTGLGVGSAEAVTAGGEAVPSASSGLGAVGNTAAVLAIIAGQKRLSDLTKTKFEGQKTGDFFTFDDQGRWSPRFGNEPWHGFMNQQWGLGPSAGEKFDAAVANNDWGLAAKRLPSTVQQWINPVGDFGYDAIEGKWGPEIAGALDPITYGFDKVAESEDIGDFIGNSAQASANVIDPVGSFVGSGVSDAVTNWTGNETLGDIANAFVNPVGAVADVVDNWSFLCTETEKIVGLGADDRRHLNKVQLFTKGFKIAKHYYKNAPILIKAIAATESSLEAFYSAFYVETIVPVIQYVKHGKMMKAFNHYKNSYLNLLYLYTPELLPKCVEVEHAV